MTKHIPTVLTIAGSDPSGGAGIQADIKTISSFKAYAASVITAITVQNTIGVESVDFLSGKLVSKQFEAVASDLKLDTIKIGMTGTQEIVEGIVSVINKYNLKNIIFDPVMVSTSGKALMDENCVAAICSLLFPIVTLATPNINEAEYLLKRKIGSVNEMKNAAKELSEMYGCAFLVKGGHLDSETMFDVLFYNNDFKIYSSSKIETKNLHGTGCTLSSAIASNIARGLNIEDAISNAKVYIARAIFAAKDLEIGHGNGPLWHFPEV